MWVHEGAADRLGTVLIHCRARRVLLVTARHSYITSGAADIVEAALQNIEYIRFFEFDDNPTLADVVRGYEVARRLLPDTIVAVGGGSVMDMAKLINVAYAQQADVQAIIEGRVTLSRPSVPLVAIPTTTGTGSEATHFAVAYVGNRKYSVGANHMRPEYVLVDARLAHSQPPYLAACAGFDALAQAIESYWAMGATPQSRHFAARAIQLLWRAFVPFVVEHDQNAGRRMALGAYLAGRAIDISKTTAPHAMSYALTKLYGLPHGHAVALTLWRCFEITDQLAGSASNHEAGTEYVHARMQKLAELLDCFSPQQAAYALRALMRKTNLETSLMKLGVDSLHKRSMLVESINMDRLANHPVRLDKAALYRLVS